MKKQLLFAAALLVSLIGCQQAANDTQENSTVQETPAAESEEDKKAARIAEEHALFRAGYADSVNTGLVEDSSFKGSARRQAKATVGGVNVTVNYGSPGKRGRVLWNGLVSYDQVWVSGSHWATAVSFDKDVKIAGTPVAAGMYGFFTIPGTETWTLILNKNYDQHLADNYNQADDVVRIQVTPTALDSVVQRLTYSVAETESGGGLLTLAWDELSVSMPFEVQ